MADRIIRDELLSSERWLDLPTDAARLAFVGFVLICDDFGNFEGGPRRLFRFLQGFTQMKTEDSVAAVIDALMACDLIRRYVGSVDNSVGPVDNREFFHIPRFKSHRQYLSRHCPPSPWCRAVAELGKDKRIFNKGHAKNIVATSHARSSDVAEGVGVGVGVGVGEVRSTTTRPRKRGLGFTPPDWIPAEPWNAWIEARTKARKPPTDYALKLAVRKLDNLRSQGQSVHQVLMQSAFNGWSDLFEVKERA